MSRPDKHDTAATLQVPVRSALGRSIPAAEVPWMRIREVWLHAVDLDAGATMNDAGRRADPCVCQQRAGRAGGR